MLIMKMHTCKNAVVKTCNFYIKEQIEEIVEVCNYMYCNLIIPLPSTIRSPVL